MENQESTSESRPYYLVSTIKVLLMSLFTFNIYLVYWWYKQWKCFSIYEKKEILCVVRSMLPMFFISPFVWHVTEKNRAVYTVSYYVIMFLNAITFGYFGHILGVLWYLPMQYIINKNAKKQGYGKEIIRGFVLSDLFWVILGSAIFTFYYLIHYKGYALNLSMPELTQLGNTFIGLPVLLLIIYLLTKEQKYVGKINKKFVYTGMIILPALIGYRMSQAVPAHNILVKPSEWYTYKNDMNNRLGIGRCININRFPYHPRTPKSFSKIFNCHPDSSEELLPMNTRALLCQKPNKEYVTVILVKGKTQCRLVKDTLMDSVS